jgi:hypothetical protein
VKAEKPEVAAFYREAGERLRMVRLAMGHRSAAAFARFLGLPPSTVRAFEAGRLRHTDRVFAVMLAAAERCPLSLDWLWMGDLDAWRRERPPMDRTAKVVILDPRVRRWA